MTDITNHPHGSTSNAHAETVPATPSNWVKPELIELLSESVSGKIEMSYELNTPYVSNGAS